MRTRLCFLDLTDEVQCKHDNASMTICTRQQADTGHVQQTSRVCMNGAGADGEDE